MNAPPVMPPPKPSRLPLQLATVALCLLIAINALTLICSIGLALATSKGWGVSFGSVIFVLAPIAVLIALLALPAICRYQDLVWPRFVFALGFTPLPVMAAVGVVNRLLRIIA